MEFTERELDMIYAGLTYASEYLKILTSICSMVDDKKSLRCLIPQIEAIMEKIKL